MNANFPPTPRWSFQKWSALCAIAVVGTFLAATPVLAQTLVYSDDFSNAAGDLNGNTVQTSSGAFGGTLDADWLSQPARFNYSGSGSLNVATDFATPYYAFLPLALQGDRIYTLTVDINPDNVASSNFLGVGFANNNTTATPTQGGHSPWVRYARNGTGLVTDGATQIGSFGSNVGTSDPIRVTLTLDTTGTFYETTWSIFNLTTSTSLGSGSFTYTTNPTVSYVFLNTTNSNGSFDNFQLTAVPEPSSIALLGLGWLVLSRRMRRRSGGALIL